MSFKVTLPEVILRLVLSVLIAGIVGYDREHKNRPAGIKTYTLVCSGACIIALLQEKICYDAVRVALMQPKIAGVVKTDESRLIAQVVSGIGFLGAGTILVQHRTVLGLTTAASLWAVAGIGLAIGLGDYVIGIAGSAIVVLILFFSKRLIPINVMKRLEIQYKHKIETKEFLQKYFDEHNIIVTNVNFKVTQSSAGQIYVNIYEIEIPHSMNYADIIEDISMNKNIMRIQMVSI